MRITLAEDGMVPALRAVWKECFGDPDSYIDFYFARRFRCENTLVALEGEDPAAMTTLLPARLRLGGELRPVSYLYAVATRTKSRGQGVSTRLLEEANRLSRERGEAMTLLVPAQASLFDFYGKRGYFPAFQIKTRCFRADELAQLDTKNIVIENISASEYKIQRDRRFDREGYLCWDEEATAYALEENRENGGFCCKISALSGQGALLCTMIGEKLLVREAALNDSLLPAAVAVLAKRTGCASAEIRLPVDSALDGAVHPFGMTSVPLEQPSGYMNLVLD